MAQSSDFGSRLESINKMLNKIADRETPLLKRHLDLSNPVTNYKHEWVEKPLVGFTDTIAANLASTTATIVTLNGGTNAPKRIIDNVTVLLAGSERMLVTSTITVVTNARQVVVTRGYHSSTPATYAAGKQVKILNSRSEGFTAGRDDTQKGTRVENYSVLVEREAKVTETADSGLDTVGMESRLNEQVADLTPELLKEVEQHFLFGEKYLGADHKDRSSGGLIWWANNVGNSTTASTLNRNLIESVIRTYLAKGGDPNKMMLCLSVNQQSKLNDMKAERIVGGGQSQSENTINNYVETYNFGKYNVNVFFSTDLRDDEVIFYDESRAKVRPVRGQQLRTKPLPEDGHFKRKLVFGEYVFEIHNARETLYHYYGLATAA